MSVKHAESSARYRRLNLAAQRGWHAGVPVLGWPSGGKSTAPQRESGAETAREGMERRDGGEVPPAAGLRYRAREEEQGLTGWTRLTRSGLGCYRAGKRRGVGVEERPDRGQDAPETAGGTPAVQRGNRLSESSGHRQREVLLGTGNRMAFSGIASEFLPQIQPHNP